MDLQNEGTPLIRTLPLVPATQRSVQSNLWSKDTPLIRTLHVTLVVSVMKRFHGIYRVETLVLYMHTYTSLASDYCVFCLCRSKYLQVHWKTIIINILLPNTIKYYYNSVNIYYESVNIIILCITWSTSESCLIEHSVCLLRMRTW